MVFISLERLLPRHLSDSGFDDCKDKIEVILALARKGSRTLVTGGVRYRWVVSPDSDFIVLVVLDDEWPGQKLEVQTDYDDLSIPQKHRQITPDFVVGCIEEALQRGWQPRIPGLKPFCISFQS